MATLTSPGTTPGTFLYHLTLQGASQITAAVHGNFSGTKQQFIAVSHGKSLELLRPDPETAKVISVLRVEIFGAVRSLEAFRLTGGNKDYLVVGSDSGRITILEYLPDENRLKRVHQETFGKSGCRRIVPGQYLATDPKGRAVMIAAAEKQKLVYILNRDAAARLTISSPLEAHKPHTFVYDIVGMDVGFENPVFACLELDYEDVDEDVTGETLDMLSQTLTFYELDLGLNHVVRKESIPLDEVANKLIAVPGGADGPSGVLVCTEGHITWRTFGEHTPVTVSIPRRADPLREDRPTVISAVAMHKTKRMFFFLVQTEEGDLFKLTMVTDDDEVRGMIIKYFDTVPVANALCLLKSGYLFVAAEFGNHHLYEIAKLGENEDEPSFLSIEPEDKVLYFRPRGLLNLELQDQLESAAPILACTPTDLAQEGTAQFLALCGRGARSTFRVMRHGLEVTEMAVSELPGNPNAVWSIRRHVDDPFDSYIVLSFTDATLVLGIGESVEEVQDSGFLATVPTLSATRLGENSLLQIYPGGIRHIRGDGRVNEWKAPGAATIVQCAANEHQVTIALSNSELVYFELDRAEQLNEYTERLELTSQPTAMALAPIPAGERTARFLAMGLTDNTVRLLSLDASSCLQTLPLQMMPEPVSSLCMTEQAGLGGEPGTIILHIGLETGVLVRTTVDPTTGDQSDTRMRYLGARPVKLHAVRLQGGVGVLALTTRPWLYYTHFGAARVTPLSYETLEYAHSFRSEQCPEGLVAVSRNTLRILSVDKLGTVLHHDVMPLQYTGRRMAVDPESGLTFVVEGDQGAQRDADKAVKLEDAADRLPEETFGEPAAPANTWASNLRVVDAAGGKTTCTLPMEPNEMLLSVTTAIFQADPSATFVVAGGVRGWKPREQKWDEAFLLTYRLVAARSPVGEDGAASETAAPAPRDQLELVHRTVIEGGLPVAVRSFQGRLLVGVGRLLRLYDLGKKKLLRKCENKHLPNTVMHIEVMGSRVVVCDQKESFFFVKYRAADNVLSVFCDDTNPRWTTTACLLDYQTVCGADKFGNICVARLPTDASDEVTEDPTGAKAFWSRGVLNGAPQKLDVLNNFYVGETVQSVHRLVLRAGGKEAIVYTTMAGAVGVLVPFVSKEEFEFFQTLEMHLRQEHPPLCGRDHLAYRSYYFPCKNVVDGDLCEQFGALNGDLRREIAESLDRVPTEVSKRLEELRNRYAF